MTVKSLPAAPEGRPFARENRDLPSSAMERWNGGIKAAKSDGNSISVFDVIGADWYGDGVTASRIAAALRSIGGADVTVNINSPGGDMFEGLAIYNLLREYEGKVTVKVLGLAASAASIIAMAGDEVQIGRGAFLMIHNCWVYAMGNRHDLAQVASDMEPFDKAMNDIYGARTGLSSEAIEAMMNAETYIGGSGTVITWDDLAQVRDSLNEAIDREMERVSDDELYQALVTVRTDLNRDISARLEQVERMTERTPAQVMPALVLAADWYDSASRAGDITARNGIRHPGFVPVQTLRVPVR